jgi:MFS family permease
MPPSPQQSASAPLAAPTTKRLLAWAAALLLAITTLPLYILSLYNHPYYDDYGFSAATHAAWRDTGSLPQVVDAALDSAQMVRNTWQGTYTGTLLSNLQPGVFGEHLYFLTTFLLLTAFLLCFGFFLGTIFGQLLGLGRAECVILISLTLTLLVQFMPDPDEAFFWFNGGIGNTFIYSLLALSLALCLKLERAKGRIRPLLLMAALAVLMILLGGGSYVGGVFGLLIYGLVAAFGFARKSRWRFTYPAMAILFLLCFLYSMTAPGNSIRAGVIGSPASPVMAVFQALYYGIAVGGGFIRLPLIGITVCLLPFLSQAAKQSSLSFRHPWLILIGGVCLYCAQFAPTFYSGVGIGGGRIVDTYFQSFVILWLLYAFYLTGYILRQLEDGRFAPLLFAPASHAANGQGNAPAQHSRTPLLTNPSPRQRLVLAGCCLILVGCLAYKLPDDASYGPQNMAGASAALSLLRGEAQQYHREMSAREALLNDPTLPDIELSPLSTVPELFMKDLLAPGAPYNGLPSLQAYYGKTSIAVKGE